MARRPRPGFPSIATLPANLRGALEPVLDLLSRVVLSSNIAAIKQISGRVDENLASTATLADTITRVNELAAAVNANIAKANEIIARLQED